MPGCERRRFADACSRGVMSTTPAMPRVGSPIRPKVQTAWMAAWNRLRRHRALDSPQIEAVSGGWLDQPRAESVTSLSDNGRLRQ